MEILGNDFETIGLKCDRERKAKVKLCTYVIARGREIAHGHDRVPPNAHSQGTRHQVSVQARED